MRTAESVAGLNVNTTLTYEVANTTYQSHAALFSSLRIFHAVAVNAIVNTISTYSSFSLSVAFKNSFNLQNCNFYLNVQNVLQASLIAQVSKDLIVNNTLVNMIAVSD